MYDQFAEALSRECSLHFVRIVCGVIITLLEAIIFDKTRIINTFS